MISMNNELQRSKAAFDQYWKDNCTDPNTEFTYQDIENSFAAGFIASQSAASVQGIPSPASSEQEPVARVTGYHAGYCVIQPTQPVILPTNMPLYAAPLPQDVIGMKVSMDVSTGDEDATHRIFGRVEQTQQDTNGKTMILATEESRNFTVPQGEQCPSLPYKVALQRIAECQISAEYLRGIAREALAAQPKEPT